jgi:hypothetical protein
VKALPVCYLSATALRATRLVVELARRRALGGSITASCSMQRGPIVSVEHPSYVHAVTIGMTQL